MTNTLADHEKRLDAAIGERVRVRRELTSVSQAKLEAAIGGDFQQVQRYETGRNRIAASKPVLIAQALSCDAADLIGAEPTDLPGVGAPMRARSCALGGRFGVAQRESVTAMRESFTGRSLVSVHPGRRTNSPFGLKA